jgi:hypothetical protein
VRGESEESVISEDEGDYNTGEDRMKPLEEAVNKKVT